MRFNDVSVFVRPNDKIELNDHSLLILDCIAENLCPNIPFDLYVKYCFCFTTHELYFLLFVIHCIIYFLMICFLIAPEKGLRNIAHRVHASNLFCDNFFDIRGVFLLVNKIYVFLAIKIESSRMLKLNYSPRDKF